MYPHVEIAASKVKIVGGDTREQFTAIERVLRLHVVLKVMLHV